MSIVITSLALKGEGVIILEGQRGQGRKKEKDDENCCSISCPPSILDSGKATSIYPSNHLLRDTLFVRDVFVRLPKDRLLIALLQQNPSELREGLMSPMVG
jgi:hypothetical protein